MHIIDSYKQQDELFLKGKTPMNMQNIQTSSMWLTFPAT